MAKDIDIIKAKGTEQSVISSLTPPPVNMDVDQDVVLKAVFDVELDAKHVQKNNVKLKKITESQDFMIDGEVAYDANENAVTFKPSALLTYGYYEVEFNSLKAIKAEKSEQIKEIKYRFYVPEVINGHKLPPEADEILNNSTLLGIDMNENGVRDDVERWIIIKYSKDPKYSKTKTAIALQYAKASQYIIVNDPAHAYENKTYEVFDYAMDCEGYWHNSVTDLLGLDYIKFILDNHIFDDAFKSKMFNTRERTKAYWKFNGSLSGHMLGGGGGLLSSTKDKCETDIDALGEW